MEASQRAMWIRERSRTLQGTIQIDEAFLGGEASGKDSLGRKGKVPLLAAVSATAQGKPEFVCLSAQPATGEDVLVFTLNSIEQDSLVVSDGAPSFNYVKWGGAARHKSIVTGGGKQACEIPELKAVNTVPGQSEDCDIGHLPCVQVREVRLPLLGGVPIQVQPKIRSQYPVATVD